MVFIQGTGSFLPNQPISVDQLEKVLGRIGKNASRSLRIISRSNGIKTRYFALDPETGQPTHTNAQLTAEAVRKAASDAGIEPWQIQLLACGSSSPDQFFPGHANMVQGELGVGPCEVASTAGVCVSGVTALRYAFNGLRANPDIHYAVATGSELASTFLYARYCGGKMVFHHSTEELEAQPELAFNADFLRWMLSDGAGAVVLASSPAPGKLSLRIDWIDIHSYSHEYEACMFAGANKGEDGKLLSWRLFSPQSDESMQALRVKQDVRLLNEQIVYVCVDRALRASIAKHGLTPDQIQYFLPHYSSEYFRDKIYQHMAGIGFEIPYDRWFTNLTTCGNTGSASIYIILDELYHSGRLKPGDRLLCFVPESGRFTIAYMLLTVVEN